MREHFLCIVKWENGFGAPHIGVCLCASLFAARLRALPRGWRLPDTAFYPLFSAKSHSLTRYIGNFIRVLDEDGYDALL